MATDDTITRYGSTGASQGFAIVVRPDGPWVRYEDHERALSAALRERDEARAALEMRDTMQENRADNRTKIACHEIPAD